MERSPIVEAQLTFQEEETKLWEGIEEYKEPAITSQDPITGIVEAADNRILFCRLQRRRPFNYDTRVLLPKRRSYNYLSGYIPTPH